jgi:TRAP-type C4-dicarboxylate transport system permease small subunit
MLKTLDALNKRIDAVLQAFIGLCAVIIVVVNLAQISGRYLFFHSIAWSEELSTYMYVWIILLSLHMITRERADICIDILSIKNPKTLKIILVARDIITIITVLVLFVSSIMIIKNAFLFPRRTASLGLTTAPLYLVMPFSFALVLLQRFTNMLHNITGTADPNTKKEK